MKLIVGLGNPGARYEVTRHNVGFLLVDRLIDRWKATGPTTQSKAEVYKATVGTEKVLLIKPQTFMNLSGISVGEICTFFKIEPNDVIVIHDDLDIIAGNIRVKTGGGNGGHNGLKSIDQHLGHQNLNYHRLRMGIGRPSNPKQDIADYVLESYSQAELNELDAVLDQASEAIELCLKDQVKEAMNRFNRRNSTDEEETSTKDKK